VLADAGLAALAQELAAGEVVAVPEGWPAATTLLEAVARASGPVVRLYRGDPWLHPAHAAERAALVGAGLAVESVAGVATEVAVPALAGVPVHVRRLAVACTLGPFGALPAAADPARTLVASGNDPVVMARAVASAGDGRLPAALIAVADPQGAWRGPLAQVPERAAAPGPLLLVVGAVCAPPGMAGGGP
jgi:siroheme synthase